MALVRTIMLMLFLAGSPLLGLAAEHSPSPVGEAAGHGAAEAVLVTPAAPVLFHLGPLPITNSIFTTWIVAGVIFLVARFGSRRMALNPSGLQNFLEWAVESLENLTQSLLEPKVARWVFPLVATYFIFILSSNLVGLFPGVGSIGFGPPAHDSSLPMALAHASAPFLRPPTSDANMTVAMSAIFFVMSTFWALRYNGPLGLVKHVFGVKGGMTGFIVIPMSLVFIFIGCIEVVSICIRPVALAMRLYGNIYGGESVLALMLGKAWGFGATLFYFQELLVAVVQTVVFTLLSIAFIGALCSHDEETPHEGH